MRQLLFRLAMAVAVTLVPAAARAQDLADYDYENLTFRGIGFDYGYIWPDRVEPAPIWSLRLDLGFLGPAVRIAPTMSYWTSEFRTAEVERLAERLSRLPALADRDIVLTAADLGPIQWSDLSFTVDAHVVWTAPFDIITFVGTSAGLHAMNGRGAAIEDTFVEGLLDSMTAGVGFMTGVEIQPAPVLRVYGEARYTLVSDVRYPGFRVGAALMLPPRR
ncbi:MAG TPA: hypothetical protein VK929_14470 [Longimicrobiales bacterium]|nr:hypothetical protein [Longimicrobiales bacterium]